MSSIQIEGHNINEINLKTDDLVKKAYTQLRKGSRSKLEIQELEETLSHEIYYSEGVISEARECQDEALDETYYRRRTILKRIADGLAWIILDFDVHYISGCSIGHSAGFMFGKEGYKNERNIVKASIDIPEIKYAIQCDITNVLHLADVIVVKQDGQIMPIELKGKSSKGNRRAKRQKKRFKEIIEFLNNGQNQQIIVKDFPLRTIKSNIVFEHYWGELEKSANEALREGFSWTILDDCIFLAVINSTISQGSEKIYLDALKNVKWQNPKLIITSLGRHIQKNITNIPVTCFPITLFPIQIELGIQFLLGNLDAVLCININEILKRLQKVGLNAVDENNSIIVHSEGRKILICEGAWAKILNEMVTVQSFIDYCISFTKSISEEFISEAGEIGMLYIK